MDIYAFLGEIAALPGASGHERVVADRIGEAFRPLVDEVSIDGLSNVFAKVNGTGPRVMITAHQDEIALMVFGIEQDGCLRVTNVGGLPARVLPASEVMVHAKDGALYGVIGAKPPHLLSDEDQKKAVQMKDLYVDLGLTANEVKAKVRVGDLVTMVAPLMKLEGSLVAGKTMDDRCCVASMLLAAERLKGLRANAQVAFVAASQEEVGCRGAGVAAYAFDPDVAIAIDVTHAETPGADKWESHPIEKMTIGVGPNMHPDMTKRLMAVADEHKIAYTVEPCGHATYTDASAIQIAGTGIPTLLIGVPLKYMHSSVEVVDMDVVREVGRLLAQFVLALSQDEEVSA